MNVLRHLVCAVLICSSAWAVEPIQRDVLESLPNASFHSPNWVASGRLKAEDIGVLKEAGIRHVIDLSADAETPDFDEAAAVRAMGMGYDNLPIHGADGLSMDNVRKFDALMTAADGQQTLIHCASSNRVGALIALRAAILQGESVEAALELGKSWGLKSLEPAVRARLASAEVVADSANDKPRFPRIQSAGGVYALGAGIDMPAPDARHRLVIDATGDETIDGEINRRLEVVARAVNLYALAGVPDDQVHIAVVIHGKTTPIVLSDASYQEHFNRANPNAALIEELRAAGVEFFVCGQALRHRGYALTEVRSGVHIALSAMTKLVELQAAGYALIP
ncbi:MAG TPA: DsrE family protein [Dokdonella sp.]|uniref:DsrE family protein n=1 Tax=Dokdonella sp. TaxID=2291710 RepID=UPI002D7F3DD2|nr:DsrE family protein [Dokdonella sp.]HET9031492.1 DsrE family protein [Dokdonella sp.]